MGRVPAEHRLLHRLTAARPEKTEGQQSTKNAQGQKPAEPDTASTDGPVVSAHRLTPRKNLWPPPRFYAIFA